MRQKFQEKEAAKDRKYAEAEAKAQRKREKKQMSRVASEQSSLVGVAYASQDDFPSYREPVKFDQPPRLYSKDRLNEKETVKTKQVGNRWKLFWIGVRAWLLKMSKKMGAKEKGGKRE